MANIKKIKKVPGGLGDATPDQVLAGVTFSSKSGVQQVGTLNVDESGLTLTVRIDDEMYPIVNASAPEKQEDGSYTIKIK